MAIKTLKILVEQILLESSVLVGRLQADDLKRKYEKVNLQQTIHFFAGMGIRRQSSESVLPHSVHRRTNHDRPVLLNPSAPVGDLVMMSIIATK